MSVRKIYNQIEIGMHPSPPTTKLSKPSNIVNSYLELHPGNYRVDTLHTNIITRNKQSGQPAPHNNFQLFYFNRLALLNQRGRRPPSRPMPKRRFFFSVSLLLIIFLFSLISLVKKKLKKNLNNNNNNVILADGFHELPTYVKYVI